MAGSGRGNATLIGRGCEAVFSAQKGRKPGREDLPARSMRLWSRCSLAQKVVVSTPHQSFLFVYLEVEAIVRYSWVEMVHRLLHSYGPDRESIFESCSVNICIYLHVFHRRLLLGHVQVIEHSRIAMVSHTLLRPGFECASCLGDMQPY